MIKFYWKDNRSGLFQIHPNPNLNCPIGANIQSVIEVTLLSAQEAMENAIRKVTMFDVVVTKSATPTSIKEVGVVDFYKNI